jgi:hypothetical protein
MAVSSLGSSFKSAVSKWCRIRIKTIKLPGKDRKVKDHLFDSGKCQATFHQLSDKIDEIITEMRTEEEIQDMIDVGHTNGAYAFQSDLTTTNANLATTNANLATTNANLATTNANLATTNANLADHEALGWSQTASSNSQYAHGHAASDRRLKTDVNIIGKSPSGLNIYTFRFVDFYRYGDELYQGVMSDEVPQSIVTQDNQGYDMVDYGKIDVDFVKISDVK